MCISIGNPCIPAYITPGANGGGGNEAMDLDAQGRGGHTVTIALSFTHTPTPLPTSRLSYLPQHLFMLFP